MSDTQFPLWSIGVVNGIEAEYDVHWLDWDEASITIDGDEVVNFWSSSNTGFKSEDDVIGAAIEVVFELEEEEWD